LLFKGGSPSAVFSEVFADFIGITSEDFVYRFNNPDPTTGQRTDFKLFSGAATFDWTGVSTACGSSSPLSKRVSIGRTLYRGWTKYQDNYTLAYRDSAFLIWRWTFLYALYFTRDMAPTSLDVFAAITALTTPPQLIINNRPPPSNLIQAQMALLSNTCWQ